jgi:hypothetical protein
MEQLPITEAVYTFVETDGTPVHIAASTLLYGLETRSAPVTRCMIAPSLVAALERGDLGVEPPHALRLPESALEAPGIVGEWGDAHIIIDGAHRLWRRWKRGDPDFPAYVLPEALWREFQISGMPGSGEFWRAHNKTAEVRTPEMELLLKLLGG